LLFLKDRILGPSLDAADVEADIARGAAPDGVILLNAADADKTVDGVDSIGEELFGLFLVLPNRTIASEKSVQ
jgi:hypothetical protein